MTDASAGVNAQAQEVISEWVSFRVNPRPRNIEGGAKIGTDVVGGEVVHNSRYIGTFYSGRQGFVFPYSYIVEYELEKQEKKSPDGPWVMPIFAKESRNSFQAYAIDDRKLDLQKGDDPCDKNKLRTLEAQVFVIHRMYQRIINRAVAEKIIIVIDYQYFSKSIREEGKTAGLDELVDLICWWGAVVRRDENIGGIKRVHIVDFFNPMFSDLYESWKSRGFQPVQVEDYRAPLENSIIENPTDKIIIETSLREVEALHDDVDTFCLVSGDRHFHNLIRDIRGKGKKVLVASFKRNTTRDMYVAANLYIDLSVHLGGS